jgi:diacylglycerol kinase family enzyme
VVVNPIKVTDLPEVHARFAWVCAANGWSPPSWLQTTADEPGTVQARRAVEEGADLGGALGGDGTVRAVVKGLLGSETPIGLLPGGTGNLLARNLDLPIDSVEKALVVALTGHNKSVDVGHIVIDRSGEDHTPEEDHFVVMAGLGFDAAVMAGAPEHLKRQVGNAAYIASGLRNMWGPQFRIRMSVDGHLPFSRRAKTVLFGNCGRIFGGLVLMPEAKIDDGLVDAVIMSPKGLAGWTAVLARVLSRQRRGHPIVDHHTGTEITVRCDRPEELQLDGDTLGPVRRVTVSVVPKALVVRVPPPAA